jgi:hypothetical protein
MVRDMELVRRLLLKVESGEARGGVEGYTDAAVNYHKALLIERALVEGSPLYTTAKNASPEIPTDVYLRKLTWEGHDFIDGIRADTKWHKVKMFLADAGKDITIETIKYAVTHLFGFG